MENYEIYEDGRIYSKRYDRFLKPSNYTNGYLRVNIDGKWHLVHRLVAQKFIPNPDNLLFVDHIDGDRTNNHVSNLRWVTCMTNNQSINTSKPVGHWYITPSGNFRHIISINGTTHRKNFNNFSEMMFYNLVLKYCLYTKYRKDEINRIKQINEEK